MGLGYSKVEPDQSSKIGMAAGIPQARPGRNYPMLRRFSVSILEEGGRLGRKCLLLIVGVCQVVWSNARQRE